MLHSALPSTSRVVSKPVHTAMRDLRYIVSHTETRQKYNIKYRASTGIWAIVKGIIQMLQLHHRPSQPRNEMLLIPQELDVSWGRKGGGERTSAVS